MTKRRLLSFLNEASHEELITLPRIGTSIANVLISERPFENLEKVVEINGINKNLLKKLQTALPEEEIVTKTGEELEEKEEGEDSEEETPPEAITLPPQKDKATSKKRGGFGREFFSGIVGALLAVFLTLAILVGINGSLKYLTNSAAQILQRETKQLAMQADTLNKELNEVRSRVGTLEGLGNRTIALENEQNALKEELATAAQEIENMQSEIAILRQEIDAQNETLTRQNEKIELFDNFFESLQTLLEETFNPQAEVSTGIEKITEGEE